MKKVFFSCALLTLFAILCPVALLQAAPAEKIIWRDQMVLPAPFGQGQNIGVAGLLYGRYKDYVIIGGGANFPQGGPAVGGKKQFYPDVYVYKNIGNKLVLTDHAAFSYPIAYGASAISPQGIYYVGGSPDAAGARQISLVYADESGKLKVKKIGQLPFSFQNGIACYYQGALYLGLGKQDGKLSSRFYRYDLKNGALKELPSLPGPAREQAVAQILDGKLCVFSGGSKKAYVDGYGYDLSAGTWQRLSPASFAGEKISLLGAASVKLSDSEMLVIGGFNKPIYDWAVYHLTNLKGQMLADFKHVYFNSAPQFFQWNRRVLLYDVKANSWRDLGVLPFAAPCGEALVLSRGHLICASGEIKPGVRSNEVHIGLLR